MTAASKIPSANGRNINQARLPLAKASGSTVEVTTTVTATVTSVEKRKRKLSNTGDERASKVNRMDSNLVVIDLVSTEKVDDPIEYVITYSKPTRKSEVKSTNSENKENVNVRERMPMPIARKSRNGKKKLEFLHQSMKYNLILRC